MVKVENDAFDEIFYCQPVGAGRDTYTRQFVCAPHHEFVCGTCCMDFALLNELRYDNEYLLLASFPVKRMERIRRVVDYYYMNPRAEFRRDPTKRRSPRLAFLLTQFSGNAGVSVGKVIELAAYLSYICRSDVSSRQRICTTLDTVLLEDLYAASKNHTIEEDETFQSSDESSSEGIPVPQTKPEPQVVTKPTPQPHNEAADRATKRGPNHVEKSAKKALSLQLQNLVEQYAVVFKDCKVLLQRAGVTSFGHFFDEFSAVVSDGDEQAWTVFLRKHARTGVAASKLDPQDWPASQTRKFLDQHGLILSPRPPKESMAESARHVLAFSVACKNILYHYSIGKTDDRKENALGSRDENRRSSPEREKKITKFVGAAPSKRDALSNDAAPSKNAITSNGDDAICKIATPSKGVAQSKSATSNKIAATLKSTLAKICNKKTCFLVEPQFPLGLRLSSLPTWDRLGRFVKCHPFFVRSRIAYTKAFPLDTIYHRVLDLLELLADTYDRTLESHPPQDFLIVLSCKPEDGGEKSLAVRCLGAHNLGSGESPIPVLQLEYLVAEHDPASNAYQKLSKGIRSGTTRFINEKCEAKDMDLLVLMLQTNFKQLPADGVAQNFSSKQQQQQQQQMMVSPGWNLSCVRSADSMRRGAFPLCPQCNQSASMVCSLCREISYCSRECQVADWKRHYQECKKCKATTTTTTNDGSITIGKQQLEGKKKPNYYDCQTPLKAKQTKTVQ